MSRRHHLVTLLGTLVVVSSLAGAEDPVPEWLEPSGKWYGVDGNWSSTRLLVGEPAQEMDVFVSTSISEIWVVENSRCGGPLCSDTVGGVFNRSASKTWSPMGLWPLGLEDCGIDANGDYGMEKITIYDNIGQPQTSLGKLLVAGVNDTAVYNGFFGLGISKGNFDTVAQGPIASLVEQQGLIPSYSYGYTAGAYYAGEFGVPMSLTLGGYDAYRFEPHDIRFPLSAATRQPQVQVRSITAKVSSLAGAPTEWSSPVTDLLALNESLTAIIDSSTPYLWLPPEICDHFASALNLTWNETYSLYLFSGPESLERYRSAPDLSFAFALSSPHDKYNAQSLANITDIVNITISANAFIQNLQYPFKNQIPYGAPAIPYFPLRRAEDGSQLLIGRSFLQEAYIITNYETSSFSIHEALFPPNPLRNTSIQAIAPPPNSPYPRASDRDRTITHSQLAGAVIGACLGSIGLITVVVLLRRRRKRVFKDDGSGAEEFTEKYATSESDPPMRSRSMALFRIMSRGNNQSETREIQGHMENEISGVDAVETHEYQQLTPPPPVELDASNTITTNRAYFAVPAVNHSSGFDSYHRPPPLAQLPHRTGPGDFFRSSDDNSRAAYMAPSVNTCYRDTASPMSSPTQEYDFNGVPSPITPASDGPTCFADLPSPIAGFTARTLSDAASSPPAMVRIASSPIHASNPMVPVRSVSAVTSASCRSPISMPAPLIQRTPIDSTRVLCLGPLPDNIQLPHQLMLQKARSAQNLHDMDLPAMPNIPEIHSRPQSIAETLGSNYTLEEEARIAASGDNVTASERIDGYDIVHVPQVARQRFSWEE